MTPSEIIDAAREAGLQLNLYAEAYPVINEQIIKMGQIIAAKQREKDAQICERTVTRPAGYQGQWEGYGPSHNMPMTGPECAAAIRGQE